MLAEVSHGKNTVKKKTPKTFNFLIDNVFISQKGER